MTLQISGVIQKSVLFTKVILFFTKGSADLKVCLKGSQFKLVNLFLSCILLIALQGFQFLKFGKVCFQSVGQKILHQKNVLVFLSVAESKPISLEYRQIFTRESAMFLTKYYLIAYAFNLFGRVELFKIFAKEALQFKKNSRSEVLYINYLIG